LELASPKSKNIWSWSFLAPENLGAGAVDKLKVLLSNIVLFWIKHICLIPLFYPGTPNSKSCMDVRAGAVSNRAM